MKLKIIHSSNPRMVFLILCSFDPQLMKILQSDENYFSAGVYLKKNVSAFYFGYKVRRNLHLSVLYFPRFLRVNERCSDPCTGYDDFISFLFQAQI